MFSACWFIWVYFPRLLIEVPVKVLCPRKVLEVSIHQLMFTFNFFSLSLCDLAYLALLERPALLENLPAV